MMKNFFVAGFLLMCVLCEMGNAAEISHDKFNSVLKQYVKDGLVDYKGMCSDKRLNDYLTEIAAFNPDGLSRPDEIAFWLNAYNGYMLKIVCDHYPLKNLNQLHFGGLMTAALLGRTVWDKPVAVVGGKKYNLKTIDHGIIRSRFSDPRLQFGMACGAVSCPPLRSEVYVGSKLDEQLSEQTKKFFTSASFNTFDLKDKKAQLSPLMNWNAHYFGRGLPEVLAFISKYVPYDIGQSLKNHPEDWTVTYGKYDLIVNDQEIFRTQ
jgi:hypothetical protein